MKRGISTPNLYRQEIGYDVYLVATTSHILYNKKGMITQKAEPRFYKVESRVMKNNSQGLGLSHKQKHGNMHQTKFQQTSDCFVPLIFPLTECKNLFIFWSALHSMLCVDRWLIYLVHRLSDLQECIQGIIPEEPPPCLNRFRWQVPGPWAWWDNEMIFLGGLLGRSEFILPMAVT